MSEKSRQGVLDKAYTHPEIRRILSQDYRVGRTITMEYETAFPLPGWPAINIRNVDIYGLGKEYFDAFCHLRSDMRVFKISRIRWAQLATGTYGIPIDYAPSTWVEYGWGDMQDKRLEDVEAIPRETSDTIVSRTPPDKWIWPRTPDRWTSQAPSTAPSKKAQLSRKKVPPAGVAKVSKIIC